MDIKDALARLRSIVEAAGPLAPILAGLGGPIGALAGKAVAIGSTALEIAETIKTGIDNDQVIADTDDKAELESIIASLKASVNAQSGEIQNT